MKIWAVIKVGRQINGENVFVNFEKAFDSREKAENYFSTSKLGTKETINSPDGSIECYIERRVYEAELV